MAWMRGRTVGFGAGVRGKGLEDFVDGVRGKI